MGVVYTSVPIGSLRLLSVEERRPFFLPIVQLPQTIRNVIFSSSTGAFTRGLAKSYNLTDEKSAYIALTILRVVVGEVQLSGLSRALAASVPWRMDRAEKMGSEIERDLLAPVKGELENSGQQKGPGGLEAKQPAPPAPSAARMSGRAPAAPKNVLDLKKKSPAPPAPPLPPAVSR